MKYENGRIDDLKLDVEGEREEMGWGAGCDWAVVSQVLFGESQDDFTFVEGKYISEFGAFEGVGERAGEGSDLGEEVERGADHILVLFL